MDCGPNVRGREKKTVHVFAVFLSVNRLTRFRPGFRTQGRDVQVWVRSCTCLVSPPGGAGTVRGGGDEEEEQLVSVQSVATFSFPLFPKF